jgi:WD40-like Beta Propeller Repeat
MVDPAGFDDPAASLPVGTSRVRRVVLAMVASILVVSMAFLAFVSGRGQVVAPSTKRESAPAALGGPQGTAAGARLAVIDRDGQLTTMDQFGSKVVAYGTAGTRYAVPTWSPDGSRIAAIATDEAGASVHVFAVAAEPAPPLVVYASPDHRPTYLFWAPDGRSITFLTNESSRLALRVAHADGGAEPTVVQMGSPLFWTWASDGRPFVHSGDGPSAFLGEVGLWDRSRDRWDVAPGGFRAPGATADGRYRAFAVRRDAGYRIVVESVERSVRREIPAPGAAALGFNPAGDELAFIAPTEAPAPDAQPVGPLRMVDPGSGIVRRLMAGSVVAFDWSPDGKTIAALQLPTDDDRQAAIGDGIVDAAAQPGVRLRLTFIRADGSGVRSRSMVQLADAFVAQVIPAFDQFGLSHRLWAPDSTAVALPVVAADGSVDIVEIRPDGSQPRRIAPGTAAYWSP